MLRIDINLVFTIINVLLLFAIVKIFLIKPVHKILDKRRQEVEDKYAEADKVNEEALATKQKYDESIKDIENEKERRFTEARNQASGEYDRGGKTAQTPQGQSGDHRYGSQGCREDRYCRPERRNG